MFFAVRDIPSEYLTTKTTKRVAAVLCLNRVSLLLSCVINDYSLYVKLMFHVCQV